MAEMLNYCFLIWAVIMRISGRHLAPKALGASSYLHLQCFLLYPKCMSCHWTPQDGAASNTTLRLRYKMRGAQEAEECKDYITGGPNSCYFSHTNLVLCLAYEIWVEAGNQMSEKLTVNMEEIAKTEPPEGLKAVGFGTHLFIEWGYPQGVAASYFPPLFELQYREQGSAEWEQEAEVGEQTSYHIYDVKPDTKYTLVVRCRNSDRKGFWSDWSTPVTVNSGHDTARPVQSEAQRS